MRHGDSSRMYQPHRDGMMHECLVRAAFKHHAAQGDNTLKHHVALNVLSLRDYAHHVNLPVIVQL